MLVVSSPWFYWEYFEKWLRIPTLALLIENKVRSIPLKQRNRHYLTRKIAWNGLLRCQTSAIVLLECLAAAPKSLHLSLHGSMERLGKLGVTLLEQPNCLYTGPYD
ncbi:MAG: hypothetical protein ABSF96_16145, partial [Steroidobacteraceae bacterium]